MDETRRKVQIRKNWITLIVSGSVWLISLLMVLISFRSPESLYFADTAEVHRFLESHQAEIQEPDFGGAYFEIVKNGDTFRLYSSGFTLEYVSDDAFYSGKTVRASFSPLPSHHTSEPLGDSNFLIGVLDAGLDNKGLDYGWGKIDETTEDPGEITGCEILGDYGEMEVGDCEDRMEPLAEEAIEKIDAIFSDNGIDVTVASFMTQHLENYWIIHWIQIVFLTLLLVSSFFLLLSGFCLVRYRFPR